MEGVESKTYYELLGLESSASLPEIKEAYREIARVYHPDSRFYSEIVNVPLSDEDMRVFKLVTAAYNVLSNERKRTEYDRTLVKLPKWDDTNGRPWTPKNEWDIPTEKQSAEPSGPKKQAPMNSIFGKVTPVDEQTDELKVRSVRDMIREREEKIRQKQLKVLMTIGGAIVVLLLCAVAFFVVRKLHPH